MGIHDGSLAAWVKAADAAEEPGALDPTERAELARLRKENAELRTDREILRKAAAYFARVVGFCDKAYLDAFHGRLPVWVPALLIGGAVGNQIDRAFRG